MIQQTHFAQRVDSRSIPTSCQRKALRLLYEAWNAAHAEGRDVWQFALEIEQLRALGLSHTDLRRLLCWGHLEHARERTSCHARQRIFQPLQTLNLPKQTCFVLTAKGWEAALKHAADKSGERIADTEEPADSPYWDNDSRQLWWHDCLIKAFHRPAVNQELILAALEEEGWPPRIDDPLPQVPNIDSKVRLHDTIKSLNRHHLKRIIHFGGDGRGQGIQWLFLARG